MITCLETNISTHVIYILIVCLNILNLNKLNLKKIKKKRQIMYKELNEEIRNLKSDFHKKYLIQKKNIIIGLIQIKNYILIKLLNQ